ncbi:MAG: HDOD domain-containing protein [Chitinivibrionales bacterium]|nr:HDOD domain-containing protein [Chitinivibrionales bacterium]
MEFRESEIVEAVENCKSIRYRFYRITDDSKLFLNSVITTLLKELKKDFISSKLQYIVHELIDNSYRILLKRLYFKKRKLDINNKKDYETGIQLFASQLWDEEDELAPYLETEGYYTDVQFKVDADFLSILIVNKGLPVEQEMEKIRYRLNSAMGMRTIGEALKRLQDNTESAGLGTAMIIMILRKITNNPPEIEPYIFSVEQKNNRSIAKVTIALNTLPEKLVEPLSEKIAGEIRTLPVYPENLLELEKMLAQSDIQFSQVASVIEKDPALTAELLKVINSAQYFLPQKVKTIQNALSLIGIRGLRNLLLSFGAARIMKKRYGKQQQHWEHSARCAFYACTIARDYNKMKLIDDIYMGAILHDIGEIIIRSVEPSLAETIQKFCVQKGINGDTIEQLSIGTSHFKIGASVLRKWNFPEDICSLIEFVIEPLIAPDNLKEIAAVIYVADQLAMFHENRISLSSMQPTIFNVFDLKSSESIKSYSQHLQSKYSSMLEKKEYSL